jgi:hypothetical protein
MTPRGRREDGFSRFPPERRVFTFAGFPCHIGQSAATSDIVLGHDDSDLVKRVRKTFFFEKKKQKTFGPWGIWRGVCQRPQDQKSFCFFFFRKRRSFL